MNENELTVELSIDELNELIEYLEEQYNNLTSGDMPDNEGRCFEVAKHISYLKRVRMIYKQCSLCGRVLDLDEEYVVTNEEIECLECYSEI